MNFISLFTLLFYFVIVYFVFRKAGIFKHNRPVSNIGKESKNNSMAEFTCLTYGSLNFHDQLYGQLESYRSVSTYGWMEISKCLLSKYTKKFSTST